MTSLKINPGAYVDTFPWTHRTVRAIDKYYKERLLELGKSMHIKGLCERPWAPEITDYDIGKPIEAKFGVMWHSTNDLDLLLTLDPNKDDFRCFSLSLDVTRGFDRAKVPIFSNREYSSDAWETLDSELYRDLMKRAEDLKTIGYHIKGIKYPRH